MIYVQIAAYKEPELVATVTDCLAKAKFKNDLRFGICWQTDPDDRCLNAFRGDKRFRIDRVPWHKSKGVCWARSRLQRLYQGEEYTLQLDAHHRFAERWDEKLLKYVELTGSPKPLLTSYAGAYQPSSKGKLKPDPCEIVATHFTPSGMISLHPRYIKGWRRLKRPVRARFVSAHFFFTLGTHCRECRYDPSLYFDGEEISLSIRSFTLGYDLFHPHRTVIWHHYTGRRRVKHWMDHSLENKPSVGLAWHERDEISKRRVRQLLREEDNAEDISRYGLGTARSHRDYELYAGIDFAGRRLHKETLRGCEPPSTYGLRQSGPRRAHADCPRSP
jgi:hypothetical protein